MIPEFTDIGGPWRVLPPGIHDATMAEIEQRFATDEHRGHLFSGFQSGVGALRFAGCRSVFLDGSFVTEKTRPADFDVCWDPAGVDPAKLDPVLLDFSDGRLKQKRKYGGEFFPSSSRAGTAWTFLEFFQIDRFTGHAKGIIRVRLPQRGAR